MPLQVILLELEEPPLHHKMSTLNTIGAAKRHHCQCNQQLMLEAGNRCHDALEDTSDTRGVTLMHCCSAHPR